MRFIYKVLLIPVIAIPLAAAWAIYLAVDREPMLRRAAEVTPANIQRAKQIIEQNNLRGLRSSNRQSVTISQQDLDVAANYLAHFYANGSARLTLNNGRAEVAASLRPPWFPVIFYFNIIARLTGGSPIPRFDDLHVGRLLLPGFIADWFMTRAMVLLLGKDAVDAAMQSVKKIDLRPGQLTVAYEWPSNLGETLRNAALTPDDQERLRAYQERLTLISHASKAKKTSLAELLVALFELAEVRSRQSSEVAETARRSSCWPSTSAANRSERSCPPPTTGRSRRDKPSR